jgi:hypothetical protein
MNNLPNEVGNASDIGTAQEKPHYVHNLIILDESGSMNSIKGPTIRGFNEVVQTIKDVEEKFSDQKHFVSLVVFDSRATRMIHWNTELAALQPLNEDTYQPNASTPLYDAMGACISRMKESLPKDATYNVLVTVITDGEENASRTYTGPMIKEMVEDLKEKSWTFAYIGANHDVEAFARRMSIDNTMRYEANEEDMKLMWAKEKMARLKMANHVNLADKSEFIQYNKGLYDEDEQP